MQNIWKKFAVLWLGLAVSSAALAKDEHGHGAGHAAHWSYEGAGSPEHWGDFAPTCGLGKAQSPLDIKGPFKHADASLDIRYADSALKLINNGHTIQVNYDAGSFLTLGDEKYQLVQFHFHRPSEEKINGQAKAMVAHFVHKSADGKLAVIGVLFDEGKENATIATLWKNLPKHENEENAVKDVRIAAADLLPAERGYYHYVGSLTTPPCTEGVAFYILKTPLTLSKAQIDAFPFKKNARPTQPLNGREIVESN